MIKFQAFSKRFDGSTLLVSNVSVPDKDGVQGPFFAALQVFGVIHEPRQVWISEDVGDWEPAGITNTAFGLIDGGKEAATSAILEMASGTEFSYSEQIAGY